MLRHTEKTYMFSLYIYTYTYIHICTVYLLVFTAYLACSISKLGWLNKFELNFQPEVLEPQEHFSNTHGTPRDTEGKYILSWNENGISLQHCQSCIRTPTVTKSRGSPGRHIEGEGLGLKYSSSWITMWKFSSDRFITFKKIHWRSPHINIQHTKKLHAQMVDVIGRGPEGGDGISYLPLHTSPTVP